MISHPYGIDGIDWTRNINHHTANFGMVDSSNAMLGWDSNHSHIWVGCTLPSYIYSFQMTENNPKVYIYIYIVQGLVGFNFGFYSFTVICSTAFEAVTCCDICTDQNFSWVLFYFDLKLCCTWAGGSNKFGYRARNKSGELAE